MKCELCKHQFYIRGMGRLGTKITRSDGGFHTVCFPCIDKLIKYAIPTGGKV